jgi:hypothetical protein
MYLNQIHPIYPSPFSPILKTISPGLTVLFSYMYIKYFDYVYLPMPSPFALPPLAGTYLQTEPVLHSCHSGLRTRFHI